jgi:hypothetical protein
MAPFLRESRMINHQGSPEQVFAGGTVALRDGMRENGLDTTPEGFACIESTFQAL